MENPAGNTWSPLDQNPGWFASFRAVLNRNRRIIYIGFFILLIIGFSLWAKNDYTLDFFRFFAAGNGPEVVINTGPGPYSHGDRLSVSWSKQDAERCDSLNGWVDTGGAVEDTADSPPIDACAAGKGQVNIECTFADGSTGNTTKSFTIDQTTCPKGPPAPPPDESDVDGDGWTVAQGDCNDNDVSINPGISESSGLCTDGKDNNCDGKADCADSACTNNPACQPGPTTPPPTPTPPPPPPGSCGKGEVGGTLDSHSSGTLRNKTSDRTCSAGIASYSVPPGGYDDVRLQQRHDYRIVTLGPGESATVSISLPCGDYQSDLFVGDRAKQPPNYGAEELFGVGTGNKTCPTSTPGPTPPAPTPTPGSSPTPTPTLTPTLSPTPSPTSTPLSAMLSISKLVKNVSQSTGELDLVAANPGETVEFIIRVTSTGNTAAQNVTLSDALPFGASYIAGSTVNDGNSVADGITSGGISLGDLVPSRVVTIRFRAQIAGAGSFNVGVTSLTNTAIATSSNTPTVNDSAFVNVTRTANLQLSLQKLGRNITRGESDEQLNVNTAPGNVIEFIIKVKSLSDAQVTNVVLKDTIPSAIAYLPNSTTLNGIGVSDGIESQGLNIGSLNPSQEAIVRFSGQVDSAANLPQGNTTVINTVQVTADNIPVIIAQLPITIANGSIEGAGNVPTGTPESLLLAVAISIIITLMYITYTRTQAFRRREAKSLIRHRDSDHDTFDFKG